MSYILNHWAFDPFLIVALFLAGWREVGLRRLVPAAAPRLEALRIT